MKPKCNKIQVLLPLLAPRPSTFFPSAFHFPFRISHFAFPLPSSFSSPLAPRPSPLDTLPSSFILFFRRLLLFSFLAFQLFSFLFASSAHAATYYWDSNGATAGAGTTPTGTWGTDAFWSTGSAGTAATANSATTALDTVNFSAGTDAVNPFTVTLNGTRSAKLLNVNYGTPTFAGGTLLLGDGGGITIASTANATAPTTISSNLTIAGSQSFNVAAGKTLALNTGTFARSAGATLNVLATGTVTSNMTNLSANANGIVGTWASYGSGNATKYATFSGSTIGGLTGTAAATAAGLTDTTGAANYDLAAATGTVQATVSANTIRYTGAAGTTAPGASFTVNGLMNAGSGNWTVGANALTIGADKELVVNAANKDIAISGAIADNAGGASGLTKTGANTLTLSGANTYTGTTAVNAGTLALNFNNPVTLNSLVKSSGTITNAGAGKVTLNNDAALAGTVNGGAAGIVLANTLTGTAWSAAGDVTLSFNGTSSLLPGTPGTTWHISSNSSCWQIGATSAANAMTLDIAGGAAVTPSSGQAGGTKYFNNLTGLGSFLSQGAASTYSYVLGNSTLGGTLTVGGGGLSFGNGTAGGAAGATAIVTASANSSVTFNSTTDATYSGNMSGPGGLIKQAANTLTLTGNNTYTGNTTVSAGALVLAAGGSLKLAVTDSSNSRLTGNGAVTVNGTFTIDLSAVTAASGSWTLVDAANVTYGSGFSVSGWSPQGGGVWTKAEPLKTWAFTQATGVLALAAGTTLFVSPGGSDTNPGTPDAPLQTLAAALPYLGPGNTLYLRAGTYRETLATTKSGTAGARITIAAYGNETVVLSGCDAITGNWTSAGNGTYTNSVAWDLTEGYNQVFVDGAMQHEAQYPNWTGNNTLLNPPTTGVTVYTGGRISSSNFSGHAANFYAGARFCGGVGSRFWWQTALVTGSSSSNLTVDTTTESYGWSPEYDSLASATGIGFVYGSLNLLDADGEWYLQNNAPAPNTLYLRIAGGGNPGAHLVEVKRRAWCINITGNYTTVSGVQTRAGAIQIAGTGNVLDSSDAGYLSHFMTWANPNNNPGGDKDEGRGIYLSGTGNTVSNCAVHDTSGSGITLTGTGHLVTRNHIYNTDYSGTYAASLFAYSGSDDTITFNTAHDSGRDILRPFGSGLAIMYNHLYNASKLCMDAGVIYAISVNGTSSATGVDTRIAYNWLHDNYNPGGDYRSPLIYFDRYCENFLVDHNVCWNNSGDNGIRLNWPNRYMRCYNNTVFKCDNFGTHDYKWAGPYKTGWTGWTSAAYPETLANNLFLSTTPQTQLVDWANNDFRLLGNATTSIDQGATVTADASGIDITYGYAGTKPDLGANEYHGAYWVAGTGGWAVEHPVIESPSSSGVSATRATCAGTLLSAGLPSATVQLFWGLTDGGTTAGSWTNNMTVSAGTTGNSLAVTQALAGLAPGSLYYFRYRAANAAGDESWTAATTFQTLSIPKPTALISGGNGTVILQVPTATGFSYQLQSTTNLLAPAVWTTVNTTAGTGATITDTVPLVPAEKTKFFRYIVSPQ